jgi:hypothetical protein
LADLTKGRRQLVVSRAECPGRPFAMDIEFPGLSVHQMLFQFAGIVGDIVE